MDSCVLPFLVVGPWGNCRSVIARQWGSGTEVRKGTWTGCTASRKSLLFGMLWSGVLLAVCCSPARSKWITILMSLTCCAPSNVSEPDPQRRKGGGEGWGGEVCLTKHPDCTANVSAQTG